MAGSQNPMDIFPIKKAIFNGHLSAQGYLGYLGTFPLTAQRLVTAGHFHAFSLEIPGTGDWVWLGYHSPKTKIWNGKKTCQQTTQKHQTMALYGTVPTF